MQRKLVEKISAHLNITPLPSSSAFLYISEMEQNAFLHSEEKRRWQQPLDPPPPLHVFLFGRQLTDISGSGAHGDDRGSRGRIEGGWRRGADVLRARGRPDTENLFMP